MEERVGLSKAAGRAPSQLLPCQPSALLQLLGRSCPPCRLLDRVLEGYLSGKASLTLPHPRRVLGRVVGMLGEKEELAEEPRSPSELRTPEVAPRTPLSLPTLLPGTPV